MPKRYELRSYVDEAIRLFSAGHFRAAIRACDQAISLYEALSQPTAEDRNQLATAFAVRGLAKQHGISSREAIPDCDEAIHLMEGLRDEMQTAGRDWPPEWGYRLAGTYVVRGVAKQHGIGSREAIPDYDEAIHLMEGLRDEMQTAGRDWPPEWSNKLAGTYTVRGIAKWHCIDPGAIPDCDKAIHLMEALRDEMQTAGRDWRPEWRKDLACAHMNRGAAKQAAIGPCEAIPDCDEAIHLMEALFDEMQTAGCDWPLDWLEDLARAYASRGTAIMYAISPDKAIPDYDEAIHLMEALHDKMQTTGRDWSLGWREALARAYTNRGAAKLAAIGPREALPDYRAAVTLVQPIIDDVKLLYLPGFEVYFDASGKLIFILLQLDDPASATDIGDESLIVAKRLEASGYSGGRAQRKYLFGLTLDAYVAAGMLGALPELIFEDLDPDVSGSACDSRQMHETAADALRRALTILDTKSEAARRAHGLHLLEAERRLTELRALYFGGTAENARLTAQLALKRGEAAEAEEILSAYIIRRPADPEGFLNRAELYGTQDQRPPALDDYTVAARLIVGRARPDNERDVRRIITVAEAMLRLKLLDVAATSADFLGDFDQLRDWLLHRVPATMLQQLPAGGDRNAAAWHAALDRSLDKLWQDQVAPKRQSIFDQSVQQQVREQYRTSLAILRRIAEDLPIPWQEFACTIADAWAEAASIRNEATDPEQADTEIIEAVTRRLRDFVLRVAEEALEHSARNLAAELGPIWETALAEPERRYLACAQRCAEDSGIARFAPLSLGCAVEHALVDRLIEPVRASFRAARQAAPEPIAEDRIDRELYGYMAGNKTLTLGPAVGIYSRVLRHVLGKRYPWPVYELVAARILQAPNRAALRLEDRAAIDRRGKALDQLVSLRNRAAHPRLDGGAEPNPQESGDIWRALVTDPMDAFFRYFPIVFPHAAL